MSTPTPRTDKMSESLLSKTFLTSYVTMQDLARTLERELAAEREKVRVLRDACESICEEWGRNHDAPFCAGSNMEKHATAALEKTEDAT